ncbi:DUF3500 domain-containing protein [Cystobacter ferrugineus]|uniref:DUF3500 domain-containing protein n=1 Tax=Cystobacter ferrugineus TaxID=83449 RepID=A0A1L9BAQ3_9BACT|nr:DUF3500 domain-containing protein [Cystobacter ferrugineus]OJH39344.1 hypothetical protein BON30_17675 [Cystobacter ferrugineus]
MDRFKFAVVMGLAVGLGVLGCHEDETPADPQPVDCSGATSHSEKVVCAANAFMATLSDSEREALLHDWSDSAAKTVWSNLPGVTRNGLALGDLDEDSRAAALAVAEQVMSAEGYEELKAILAADDYLGTQGGGGGGGGGPPDGGGGPPGGGRPDGGGGPPPGGGFPGGGGGGGYSSDNYSIAFIGTPSVTGDWMLQLGGHHLAINVTYRNGVASPTPNFIGVEPQTWTSGGITYSPLTDERIAVFGIFDSFTEAQKASARITNNGQPVVYGDVTVGPDNGSGVYPTDYPTGADRVGVLVSSLPAEQQALVTAAISAWVKDYSPGISEALLAEYTSAAAYADTYVAWAGDQLDPNVNGSYVRIDGPRVWIEFACQTGVVFRDQIHFHTILRDKTMDYGQGL